MSLRAASARAALVAVAAVVADQAVKALVRAQVAPGERISVVPGLHVVRVHNTGVAFGLFPGGGVVLVVVGGLALAALLAFFVSNHGRRLVWLPTGLLIGGAAGNLVDRVRDGFVTDFLELPHWPAFNVADMAITVGVVALVFVIEASPKQRARA